MSADAILIVDDSRLSRMMISSLIKATKPDWTIVEACSGEDALEKCTGCAITWATIDFNMPGMDGLALAERLRSQFPDARLALLTANIQDAIRTRAESLGIAFIQKPITEEKVVSYITG